MKNAVSVLGCILLGLVVLLPLGTVLTAFFGYTFELASVSVFAILTAFLAACLAVKAKKSVDSRVMKAVFSLLTPLSLISAVFLMRESSRIWVVVSAFSCVGCCLYLTIKHGKPLALKITSLVLSALLVLPVGFFGFIALIFGNIGQNTVVNTVESPNGGYYAEVIDSDQGALGGDTLVDVYAQKGVDAFVFRIIKKPRRVYSGDWGEYKQMQIHWKDENCLVIDDVEYRIE